MTGSESAPVAFVSSLTAGHERLRRDLFELGQTIGRYVWVCEHPRCRPDLSPGQRAPLEIADVLLDRVRAAQIYILILGGNRHGTPLSVADSVSSVSHFEIELFQAALHGKPVELFIARGFSPGPRLGALLEILAWALPRANWRVPMTDAEIVHEVRRLLAAGPSREASARKPDCGLRRRLIQRFYQSRWQENHAHELLFLDGRLEPREQDPNLKLIQAALVSAETAPDQERKLARLWLALRELMAAPFDHPDFSEYRLHWHRALVLWEGAATWYGLHAHLFLGGLAAVGSNARVCALLPAGMNPQDFSHPATGFASAIYSIAKLAPPGRVRRNLFADAMSHLKADVSDPGMQSNILALRGSLLLRTNRPSEAVAAYQAALRLREDLGWSAERLGESKSELGFAYLVTGRLWRGRDLLREGERLLEGGGPGFLIRAKKKMAWGHLLTGHPLKALKARTEARELAREHKMLGQL
jgi:hypothetical protein